MSTKNKIILSAILILLFLFCTALVIYPLLRNYLADQKQDEIVLQYEEIIETAQKDEIVAALEAARSYNTMLSDGQYADLKYEDILNQTGTGMMGFIRIPNIDVKLPIYHGNQSLELGAVHLEGTSLPIGGESTHSVISAHSGMSSEKMFTDLEQLVIGDRFELNVLDQTLFYEIDQILTVLPHDTTPLSIAPGEDYCTLLTCTPYGVNTHRLLVRGTRVDPLIDTPAEPEEAEKTAPKASTWTQQYVRGILSGLAIVAVVALIFVLVIFIRRKKRKTI